MSQSETLPEKETTSSPETLPEKEITTSTETTKKEENSKVRSITQLKAQHFLTIDIIQTDDVENGEANKRDSWGNGLEFLMSCIALSVGLGNVWRFPFIALENGGKCHMLMFYLA